jgi:hypothetical protein
MILERFGPPAIDKGALPPPPPPVVVGVGADGGLSVVLLLLVGLSGVVLPLSAAIAFFAAVAYSSRVLIVSLSSARYVA